MPSTDTRIVQMDFENREFEKNLATSQRSVEKFKKELDFEDATRQMQEFGKSTNSLAFDKLAANIQALADKFTGLGNIGEFVLSKIRSALEGAANSAIVFAKSLTTDQIDAGKGKYEMLNKSVQTIKNATGDTEDQVYGVLNRLNEYTDMTSYDFAAMADNIGKFTSVGIDLASAEDAMEGIANLAAKSGGGINEANRAMYNISQMMGVGHMQLIDWKSIQNANMATKEFKETVIATALETGDLVEKNGKFYTDSAKYGKATEVNYQNFQETLSKGWFTSDVMMKTLHKYADTSTEFGKSAYEAAQRCTNFTDVLNAWKDMLSTGWMKTYQTVFGELTEAMDLFSGICDKVSESLGSFMEMRNGILENWSANGGRDSLWSALVGELETPDGTVLFEGAYGFIDILNDIGDTIQNAFWSFIRRFVDPMDRELFDSSDENKQAFLGAKLAMATNSVKEFMTSVGSFFNDIPEGETESRFDKISHAIEGVFGIAMFAWEIFKGIAAFIGSIAEQLKPSFDAILDFLSALGIDIGDASAQASKSGSIVTFFTDLAATLQPVTSAINYVVTSIFDLISALIAGDKESGDTANAVTSIGDVIKSVFSTISSIIGPVITFIGDLVNIIKYLFAEGFSAESLTKAGEKFEVALQSLISGIFNFSPDLKSGIDSFFELIFGTASDDSEKNGTGFLGTLRGLLGRIIGGITGFITGAAEQLNSGDLNLFTIIKNNLGLDGIGRFFKKVSSLIGDMNLYKVIMAILGGVLLYKAIGLVGKAKEAVTDIKDMFKNFSIRDLIFGGGEEDELDVTEKIHTIAESVALIAGSIAALALFPIGSLIKGVVAVGVIFGMIYAFLKLTTKITKDLSFEQLAQFELMVLTTAVSIAAIALAISILSLALIPLSKNPGQMLTAVIGLGLILAEFVGLMWAMKKLDLGGVKIAGLAGFAFGLAILVLSLKMLGSMDILSLVKALVGMAALLFELIMFMGIIKSMDVNSAKIKGLAGFAIGIGILVMSLRSLGKMSVGELVKGLVGLGAVLLELILFMGIIKSMDVNSAKVKGLAGLAIGIALLMISLKVLSSMSVGDLVKGLVGLGAVLLELLIFMQVLKDQGLSSVKITGIVGLVLGVLGIAAAMSILANMSWEQLAKGIIGIAAVMALLLIFVNTLKTNGLETAKLTGIIAFVASIVLIALSMQMLGNMKIGQMLTAIIGLAAIMGAMLAMTKIMKGVKISGAAIGALLGLTVFMFLFSAALNEVKGIDVGVILSFSIGIAALMVGIAGALKLLEGMSLGGAVKSIAILAVAVAAIMAVLSLLAPMVAGAIGNSVKSMASKMSITASLIAEFADKMGSINSSSIDHAKEIFDKLFTLISGLGGAGEFYRDLETFGSMIFKLGTDLALYNDTTKGLPDPETSNALKTVDALVAKQSQLAGLSFGDAADQILVLGVGLGLFNKATGEINTDKPLALSLLEGLLACSSAITEFTQAPIGDFKSNLAGLGGALKLYAEGASEATGLEIGDTPDVSGAVALINAITKDLSQNGGFTVPDIPSEGELGTFGADLAALAMAIQDFANASSDISGKTDYALADLDFLVDLKERLTSDRLKVLKALNENGVDFDSLSEFSIDIGALGSALSTFAEDSKDIDTTNAIKLLDFLSDLKLKLDSSSLGVIGVFDDNGVSYDSLSMFATDIGELGYALSSFASNVAFDADSTASFDHAIEALDFLVDLGNKMPEVGGIAQLINGHVKDFSDLSDDLETLGIGLSDFSAKASVESFDYEQTMKALEAVGLVVDLATALGNMTEGTEDLMFSPAKYARDLASFIQSFVSLEGIAIDGANVSPLQDLVNMLTDLDAMMSVSDISESTNSEVFLNYLRGIKDLVSANVEGEFSPVGYNIAAGVRDGIINGQDEVVNATIAMVIAARDAATATADEHSPSKVFAKIGNFMALGMANGMISGTNDVTSAAETMTSEAITKAQTLMALISTYMSEDISGSPVITPILDLSNVAEGGAMIGAMLGRGRSMDISADIGDSMTRTKVVNDAKTMKLDTTALKSDIQSVKAEIASLGTKIAGMKFYLNNRVISNTVDADIGKLAFYASRRN